jgi:hypothetical protein
MSQSDGTVIASRQGGRAFHAAPSRYWAAGKGVVLLGIANAYRRLVFCLTFGGVFVIIISTVLVAGEFFDLVMEVVS